MAGIINKIDSLVSGAINTPFNVDSIKQNGGRCGTTHHEAQLAIHNPQRISQRRALDSAVQSRLQQMSASRVAYKAEPRTIPLVIHVLYNSDRENISDDQINSQIEILNQDFSRKNPDAIDTPNAFKSVASDTGIRFCLVKLIRQKTNVTSFSDNNDVKFSSKGGSDAVDTSKYMNIWICNLKVSNSNGTTMLGYTEFPSIVLSNTYGLVLNYEAFGTGGVTRSPFNKGRTCTHEMGHALNVAHTFDESSVSQCVRKENDIPSQSNPSYGCPDFPTTDDCSLNYPGIMFMNYMDYSNDSCFNLFTADQAKRMNATLESGPYSGLVNTGCSKLEGSALPLTPEVYQRKGFRIVFVILILAVISFFLFKYFSKNKIAITT